MYNARSHKNTVYDEHNDLANVWKKVLSVIARMEMAS